VIAFEKLFWAVRPYLGSELCLKPSFADLKAKNRKPRRLREKGSVADGTARRVGGAGAAVVSEEFRHRCKVAR